MNELISTITDDLGHRKVALHRQIEVVPAYDRCGRVSAINGLAIVVSGLMLPVGHACRIHLDDGKTAQAEVIGFTNQKLSIMPYDQCTGIAQGMLVSAVNQGDTAKVGLGLLGRVVDGLGRPIDQQGAVILEAQTSLVPEPINPLTRRRITSTLDVGVRAINGLTTICKGQRMGIFAEAGLGKSVLLGMMTKFAEADIVVVGLIGERGREVKEFIEEIIGEAGLKKTVVVAAPADTSPLMKIRGANYATAIAEYFRDLGKDVLLILDSITRYAQAYRQLSLSEGEMPTAKGYTPSVFAKLSSLIERSGNGSAETGSITAFYTVLTDSEEMNDPIAEHVRSLIDGHIILSRDLADEGHFPAINIEKSISRLMHTVVDDSRQQMTIALKRLIHAYSKNRDMINIGMYQTGADPLVDAAMSHWEVIRRYLTQRMDERASMDESVALLYQIIKSAGLLT